MMRTTTAEVTFRHPFALKGIAGAIPPGTYRIDTEEEPIDGLSFLAYRRLATFIQVPLAGRGTGVVQAYLVAELESDAGVQVRQQRQRVGGGAANEATGPGAGQIE